MAIAEDLVAACPVAPLRDDHDDSKTAAIDALLRVPGLRLERAPDIGWSELSMSYELRGASVGCDT